MQESKSGCSVAAPNSLFQGISWSGKTLVRHLQSLCWNDRFWLRHCTTRGTWAYWIKETCDRGQLLKRKTPGFPPVQGKELKTHHYHNVKWEMASLTIISWCLVHFKFFLIKVTFEVSPLYSLELRCYSWCRVTEAWPQPNTQARRRRQRGVELCGG